MLLAEGLGRLERERRVRSQSHSREVQQEQERGHDVQTRGGRLHRVICSSPWQPFEQRCAVSPPPGGEEPRALWPHHVCRAAHVRPRRPASRCRTDTAAATVRGRAQLHLPLALCCIFPVVPSQHVVFMVCNEKQLQGTKILFTSREIPFPTGRRNWVI